MHIPKITWALKILLITVRCYSLFSCTPAQCRTGTPQHSTVQLLVTLYLLSKLDPSRAASLCCAELNTALQQQGEDLQSRRKQHNVLGSRCHPDGTAWVIKVSREAEVII